jgi:hypothetical protein
MKVGLRMTYLRTDIETCMSCQGSTSRRFTCGFRLLLSSVSALLKPPEKRFADSPHGDKIVASEASETTTGSSGGSINL